MRKSCYRSTRSRMQRGKIIFEGILDIHMQTGKETEEGKTELSPYHIPTPQHGFKHEPTRVLKHRREASNDWPRQ